MPELQRVPHSKGHVDMSGAMIDTLVALVERGPVYIGNIPSKAGRLDLIRADLALADDDYTAATTLGREVYIELWGQGSNDINEAIALRKAWTNDMRKQEGANA